MINSHMEVRSDKIKQEFFQAVAESVLMNGCTTCILTQSLEEKKKKKKKKPRWQLHKDALSCFEQILEAAPNKIAAVCPLTFHLKPFMQDEQDMLGTDGEVRMNS